LITSTISDWIQALPVRDPDRVARFRQETSHRCIAYPLGSGQAEELALVAGLRPMLRQRLRPAELELTRSIAERFRLHVKIAPGLYGEGRDGRDEQVDADSDASERAFRTVLIGRDPARVERAMACEVERDDLELGRLLGYPRCCVEAFVAAKPPRANADLHASSARRTTGRFAPRLNMLDLAVFHFVSWSPCSFGCELSLRYADSIATLLDRRHSGFRVQIDEALGAHRLLLTDEVQVSMRGTFDGTSVRIEHAWPTACDRHPSATLGEEPGEAIGRILALVRAARVLSIEGKSLRLDGERIELPAAPLLLPFGARAPCAAS
jgi:hypothetical protein